MPVVWRCELDLGKPSGVESVESVDAREVVCWIILNGAGGGARGEPDVVEFLIGTLGLGGMGPFPFTFIVFRSSNAVAGSMYVAVAPSGTSGVPLCDASADRREADAAFSSSSFLCTCAAATAASYDPSMFSASALSFLAVACAC